MLDCRLNKQARQDITYFGTILYFGNRHGYYYYQKMSIECEYLWVAEEYIARIQKATKDTRNSKITHYLLIIYDNKCNNDGYIMVYYIDISNKTNTGYIVFWLSSSLERFSIKQAGFLEDGIIV